MGVFAITLWRLFIKNIGALITLYLFMGLFLVPFIPFRDKMKKLHKMADETDPIDIYITYFLFSNIIISSFFLFMAYFKLSP
ncbi:hypothetical protein GCM10011386_43920 [Parapedobacter defluvii]|uniref:Uncharacterized protein n=1 Tax=Parapedobacter defluvii TaxID=2045106 RepID=A0ABQ1MTY8_9SPHI|nr:hypothetical protein GCM10011386_43920 [Parapedobacter defluvii]